MTSTALLRQRRAVPDCALPPVESAARRQRWARRKVMIAWALLFFNALTFYPGVSFMHIPSVVGKGIAQAALPAAFLVALSVNRRLLVRPNVLLCLVTLLSIEAFVTVLESHGIGTAYRTFRLAGYVVTLWLLTPWWGRRDLLLVRAHLTTLVVLLGSVLLGLMIAPGHALYGGRLTGAVWPIPDTEVAHYAAVAAGLVIILWFCGHLRGWLSLAVVLIALAMLVLTHTRTALIGMIAGILVAGLSLIAAKARVRKVFSAAGILAAIAIITAGSFLTTWLARGEGSKELSDLTGRTVVWGPLLAFPRDRFQMIFGSGLSNKSFDGLPIDSNWLASYNDQGLYGVVICAAILLFLLVAAYFQPRGVRRALALFLVTYCLVASFTEVGFTDASPYLLEVTLAASLLVPPLAGGYGVPDSTG